MNQSISELHKKVRTTTLLKLALITTVIDLDQYVLWNDMYTTENI